MNTIQLEATTIAQDFGPLISSLAYQFFGNHDEARDAAQEAWLEILESLPDFRGDSSVKTWVYSVAWRRMLRLKNKRRQYDLRVLRLHYHAMATPDHCASGPEAKLIADEVCTKCMVGVLFCLTVPQRLAFLFRYTADLSFEDIAHILETTPVNVRKLYSRARAILMDFINSDCAYARLDAKCAYGMDSIIQSAGLLSAFERLGSFGERVAAYRILPQVIPGPNYWESYIGFKNTLSQTTS